MDYSDARDAFKAMGVDNVPAIVWLSSETEVIDGTFLIPEKHRMDRLLHGSPGKAWTVDDIAAFLQEVSSIADTQVCWSHWKGSYYLRGHKIKRGPVRESICTVNFQYMLRFRDCLSVYSVLNVTLFVPSAQPRCLGVDGNFCDGSSQGCSGVGCR